MTSQEFGRMCLFACKCQEKAQQAYHLASILKNKHNRALMREFQDTAMMLKEAADKLLDLAKIQSGNIPENPDQGEVKMEREKEHE